MFLTQQQANSNTTSINNGCYIYNTGIEITVGYRLKPIKKKKTDLKILRFKQINRPTFST